MLDKHFDHKSWESDLYRRWLDQEAFKAGREGSTPQETKKPFTIVIPPPNVTGSLHIGHALNNSLQDVLIRWRRMKGDDALWLPGTDHAGIATQMVVERKLAAAGKPSRRTLGREAFEQEIWRWKEESGGQIIGQLKRLGASCDWSRERFTLDEGLSQAVQKVFIDLYRQGLIYRDLRLVNWDPQLETAISDLEVKQTEVKAQIWEIFYPLADEASQGITVATTRPETMLGDVAVAVHPEDPRYQHLIGRQCHLPLSGRLIPIVGDLHADPQTGTGAVKITPAHDFHDFEVGKRHNLPLITIFDSKAHILANESIPSAYRGMERFAARKAILADLDACGALRASKPLIHTVPHGDRSGVPIEPWLTWQWYVDAKTLAKPAIEAVRSGATKFVPENWSKTYFNWMESIQPWCISRQLWWGHRIPAWYGPDDYVFVAASEDEARQQAERHYQSHPSMKTPITLTRDEDVLDTWFSSALWPFSTMGWPDEHHPDFQRYFPGDVLVTGFDIIFFWVARMMMMSLHFTGKVPFHTVYVHALVLDAEGRKMSKSKGNVVDPLALVDEYGADALRLTLIAQAAAGRNVRISEARVEGSRNFLTKIWNAARFCEMNHIALPADLDAPPPTANFPLAEWLIVELSQASQKIDGALHSYRYADAALELIHFIRGVFCDWHLELVKPLLQPDADATIRKQAQAVTGWALGNILKLLHPFCPFVSEAIYRSLGGNQGEELLQYKAWPQLLIDAGQNFADRPQGWHDFHWLITLVGEIRSLRSSLNVPASALVNLGLRDVGQVARNRLQSLSPLIQRLARLATIEELPSSQNGEVVILVANDRYVLPLGDLIDFAQERARLVKELQKADQDCQHYQQRLANQEFLAKAPDEVVEELQSRLEEAKARMATLQDSLQRLAMA